MGSAVVAVFAAAFGPFLYHGQELQRGQAVLQDEIFKITHTRKEKNADGTYQWVEPRAERTWNEFQQHFGEFRATQPRTTQMTD
ncbi:uncharacterized protein LOC132609224 [Lycium barbarum]|uniref:uncharacterized protein LOC132609224 n=1 Tax=Lycium barbarum TaxID=112863 RepID=UPI00293F16DE|nr:uncharacterized protein LOC132609224 [Lycium barbarum]